jgi:hypothetical protein
VRYNLTFLIIASVEVADQSLAGRKDEGERVNKATPFTSCEWEVAGEQNRGRVAVSQNRD